MYAGTATVHVSDSEARNRICGILGAAGFRTEERCAGFHALSPPEYLADLIFLECSSHSNHSGIHLARRLRRENPEARLIVLAVDGSEQLAIQALRLGAADYLPAPFDFDRIRDLIHECRRREPRPTNPWCEMAIIGESPAMQSVKAYIPMVAARDCSVLIIGETGTGKEMVAEQIHRRSPRRDGPFICMNCAAIPEPLLESELFGHEKGAFTGALSSYAGKLAQARGGTIFFDEIGDMSPVAQAKILRAIEAREIYPLGSQRKVQLDIRIVAATNRDLDAMMKAERFRADLYFRLNVARIKLPPLRERPLDIPLLIQHLLPRYNRTFGMRLEQFAPEVLEQLMRYSWPGNVRELKNLMEIVFLNLMPRDVTLQQLPQQIRETWHAMESAPATEREQMLEALLTTRWNVSEAARRLRWSRMTLYRKLARYNIVPPRTVTPRSKSATACDND